ncbi:glycosyltransferase family 2 protein [Flavobacterium franklandianum]|uniref:Glycosyltransferase n=1 Tax=Flavobacterium franklandianum TaxID=2594430 RepID=A0A553CR86_9FLAO|nr:glycosyltransferase [Flavobacterium franklandianum]TRX22997.1 glycosyltransferase [Flavobacterium franklandianum]
MFLSVIIPTYNRYDLLRKCLDNLMPDVQTIDSTKFEIIVSDDSKQNEEIKNLKSEYPFVHFISGPQKGPASNRNNGAKQAKGDWLVFIDDDCLPDHDILLSYLNEINKGVYRGIEGYINADRHRERFDEQCPMNLTGGCFWTCNIAVEKEVFNKLGGFDEGFPFAALEDTDFYERLKAVVNTTFIASAKVIHPWRRADKWANYKKWIKSHQYAIKKANTPKNFKYRVKRINLFVGSFFKNGKNLLEYKFKGFYFYLEISYCHFLLIFY